MIAVDTNVLVYAHRRDADFHEPASTRIKELAEGVSTWAIPWPSIHEFFAIVTHPRIYAPPSTIEQAVKQIDLWLSSPTLTLLGEPPGYLTVLKHLITESKVTGPKIHDARIAALCLGHGVRELWTADRDFGRFTSLVTVNPLSY